MLGVTILELSLLSDRLFCLNKIASALPSSQLGK